MSIELKVGDRIRDNDPRMKGRTLIVIHISAIAGVQAQDRIGCARWYDIKRIYTDDKPRRTGFSRVEGRP